MSERVLDRPTDTKEMVLAQMVERILIHSEMCRRQDPAAAAYWGFFEKGYSERGYNQGYVFSQEQQAVEELSQLEREVETMTYA